jgi:cyclophilin family peptidyl-prolyl cis-trans isomerase/HEAT repeat protein
MINKQLNSWRRLRRQVFCKSLWLLSFCLAGAALVIVCGQAKPVTKSRDSIPAAVMLRIVRAEDERRWDSDLQLLLSDKSSVIRRRAALAVGRIGDERAVASLIPLLEKDSDDNVREMAAFALGEVESAKAADTLLAELSRKETPAIRARVVEALGKITAALPKSEEATAKPLRTAILAVLGFEAGRRSAPDEEVILLGLTAALRARPDNAGKVIARFLGYSNSRIRGDAANTLARLKLSDGNTQLRKLLTSDPDPVVRANAARVLGATEDKSAVDLLIQSAHKDTDARVRISAVRALAAIKESRAAAPLLRRGEALYATYRARKAKQPFASDETNEILEIATALGRLLVASNDEKAVAWLRQLGRTAPEVTIAFARIAPAIYVEDTTSEEPDPATAPLNVRYSGSAVAQGWGELATHKHALIKGQAGLALRNGICTVAIDGPDCARVEPLALPDFLRAYAAFKPNDIDAVIQKQLPDADVIVRATAAELLGEMKPSEANLNALIIALRAELPRVEKGELSDATFSLLEALAKQKSAAANEAIKTALDSSEYLLRKRAVALLTENGAGDFSSRVGAARIRYTAVDYERALARLGKHVQATVRTDQGAFTLLLLPDEAPLNVDNFVMLARKGYFNGLSIHRVVPNFVIQGGDPRGDGNGGPGYQIRCEVNELTYDRGAVGMALSGKDTGGSQWFVTHSPQPHLDGGYTVFGRVITGMEVVDKIVRGDVIRSVRITEGAPGRRVARSRAAH